MKTAAGLKRFSHEMIYRISTTLGRSRRVCFVVHWRAAVSLRKRMQDQGFWDQRGEIFKAALTDGQIERWNPRPFFSGAGWDGETMELHPGADQKGVDRLLKNAVSAFRGLSQRRQALESRRINCFESDRGLRQLEALAHRAWDGLIKLIGGRREFPGVPNPFPPYNAPLCLIPKKRPGEFRSIAPARPDQISAGRSLLGILTGMIDASLPIHGFMPSRNPVTNAQAHVGFKWSLCMDLEDFFDHVTLQKLVDLGMSYSLAVLITDAAGVARQGYATSPAAANIAFQSVDRVILAALREICPGAVYTRYADDLTISGNSLRALERLRRKVTELIHAAGFKISDRKTKMLSARAGNRVITGVSVGENRISVPRETRRRLRACEHRGNKPVADGLREWTLLKVPRAC
jgi:hypothetical protein